MRTRWGSAWGGTAIIVVRGLALPLSHSLTHSLTVIHSVVASDCVGACTGCKEHETVPSWGLNNVNHYRGDVQATIDFGFDGIKLDGMSPHSTCVFRTLSHY
jgi:hypothetical protein